MTSGKKVLIVEDDALISAGLLQTVRSFGYETGKVVATGEDAVISAKEIKPDIILMDIKLAGTMDGIEAARIIRSAQDIPVIYLTAYSDDERLRESLHTEPYGYLIKPVKNDDLRTTLEITLYKHQMDIALRESEERYRAIITQAMEGIVLFDRDSHTIIETNPAFRDLVGYTEKELATMNIFNIVPYPPETVKSLFSKLECESQCRLGEQKIRRKDNSLLDVECNSSFIRYKGKNMIICVIAHDVTERKRAESALFEANKKLNLLSSITRHDVLNQLMALRAYFILTKKKITDPDLSDIIHKEEEVLDTLEHHVIFTRDYQNLGMKGSAWQNVDEIVRKVAATLPINKTRVETDRSDLELYADPLLEKVFYNLIDNALRYGGEHMTTIQFSSRETEKGFIVFCEDDGVGMVVSL